MRLQGGRAIWAEQAAQAVEVAAVAALVAAAGAEVSAVVAVAAERALGRAVGAVTSLDPPIATGP